MDILAQNIPPACNDLFSHLLIRLKIVPAYFIVFDGFQLPRMCTTDFKSMLIPTVPCGKKFCTLGEAAAPCAFPIQLILISSLCLRWKRAISSPHTFSMPDAFWTLGQILFDLTTCHFLFCQLIYNPIYQHSNLKRHTPLCPEKKKNQTPWATEPSAELTQSGDTAILLLLCLSQLLLLLFLHP